VVPVFYDPLLSKLSAWGADRRQAMARMRRALDEYDVTGIRTSLPFFRWLLRQQAFAAGEFHTAYLDDVLQQRRGRPFGDAGVSQEEVAAIAAAVSFQGGVLPAAGSSTGGAGVRESMNVPRAASRWAQQARHDALRY
jgi:acetyl/propionyl-CoA carboxylase alpha subunit